MSARPEYIHDTIVAAATPPGKGGIGVVRLSGDGVESIAPKLLGDLPAARVATHTHFKDRCGETIDTGIALYFPRPASFTGESVLELQCHGGPVVVSLLIDVALACGARRAEPGEFSQRAFLNGKIDLSQAEAIADLINSSTAQAARAAHRSLSGVFSTSVAELAESLTQLRLHVEAAIDFPEEEIDFLADQPLRQRLDQCGQQLSELMTLAGSGRALRDGLRVVIVGKPNVGKSSLLNRLSGQDAAIVTDIEGTTRDLLREQINIDGLSLELVDTAGLRDNPGQIEEEGIRRAREAQSTADIILWIRDAQEAIPDALSFPPDATVIEVFNKVDLTTLPTGGRSGQANRVYLSALTGAGVATLREQIRDIAGYRDHGEGAFTARRRHVRALQDAERHFVKGRAALLDANAGELLAEELRLAGKALAAIGGDLSSDELLGRIFSEFCIGK